MAVMVNNRVKMQNVHPCQAFAVYEQRRHESRFFWGWMCVKKHVLICMRALGVHEILPRQNVPLPNLEFERLASWRVAIVAICNLQIV